MMPWKDQLRLGGRFLRWLACPARRRSMAERRAPRTAEEQFAEGPVYYKLISDMDLLEALRDLNLHRDGETHEQTTFAVWRLLADAADTGEEEE